VTGAPIALLGLAEDIPNEDALALAPGAGWIMLFLAVCVATILIVHREGWRRLWLRAEDPRAMALFRIVFALCAMGNIDGLWELFTYLFTDEGLFLTDDAREVFAREQFRGFGNGLGGDAYGFFDFAGFLEWLKGPKYSLLFFWDTPTAFWIHWAGFQIAITALVVGYKTRWTKWIAWFLFHSIIQRNNVFWEGTENIYRTFFFYLCLSRCGHAYSVDNWLRCRKLRKQGRLSVRGGPGNGAGVAPSAEHPEGLEAIYRRIPAWPRILVILQVCAIYSATGVVKNGSVWWNGDAFYYALNLDHFYRLPPQQLSAVFGTTLFRLNSHIAHAWESLFPLCAFGLFVRFGLRERLPPLSRMARRIHTAAWIAFGLGCLALCEYLYPVHFSPAKHELAFETLRFWERGWWTLERLQVGFGVGWLLGMLLIAWLWRRLRYRPFRVKFRGKERVIDLEVALAWTTGRRVWVMLGFVFQLHVFLLMNIGWFQFGTLTGFAAFVNGTEIALFGILIGRWLSRLPVLERFIPQWVKNGEDPTPAEDPTLPHLHRDAARLPLSSMIVAVCIVVAGVFLAWRDVLAFGWTLVGTAAFVGGSMFREARLESRHAELEVLDDPYRRAPDDRLAPTQLTAPWAYGPFGRWASTCLVLYHIVGVAAWLLPDKDSFTWRTKVHPTFRWWLETTQTTQGWRMFAPNPPRSNQFLRVIVTDAQGEAWDMRTDVYAEEQRPLPWIWYTRQRKINRRISGSEGGHGNWYQKWHARWFCRQWQLDHEGELPQKVELVKITYPIPTPEYVFENGPYDPMQRLAQLGKEKVIYTAECKTEVGAQTPDVIRERNGLPPSDIEVRRWSALRHKQSAWERFKEQRAKKNDNDEE
jgi:hypothetical protein